jgi:hypothetical protein
MGVRMQLLLKCLRVDDRALSQEVLDAALASVKA